MLAHLLHIRLFPNPHLDVSWLVSALSEYSNNQL